MDRVVDTRGLSCPLPVLKTGDVIAEGHTKVDVRVDNGAARENVRRFAQSKGYSVIIEDSGIGEWVLHLRK